MTKLAESVKDYFAHLQLLKEAEAELDAAQAEMPDEKHGAISKEAHDAILALARHEAQKKQAKIGGITNATAMLSPEQEAGYHNLISSELLGTPEAPGIVRKHAKYYGNRLNLDPEEIVSTFAGGSSNPKEGYTTLPMRSTYLNHGKKVLSGLVTPKSLNNAIRGNISRTVRNAIKSRKRIRRHETQINMDDPSGEEEHFIKPEAQSAAHQREMNPLRATMYNEDQKRLAELIHKHIEAARKGHGEKGNDSKIHPDVMHDILTHHFFHGLTPEELVDRFGHKIPLKKPSGDPSADSEARRKRLYNDLRSFKSDVLEPHFNKPQPAKEKAAPKAAEMPQASAEQPAEQPSQDDLKFATAQKIVSKQMPDPQADPEGHAMFKRAAQHYRKVTGQPKLPIEQDRPAPAPESNPAALAAPTTRAVTKLRTLKKPKPAQPTIEDPNVEPEHPQEVSTQAHDFPRTPGMESVNLASRLFGENLSTVSSISLR